MPLAVSRLAVFDLDGTLTWSDSFRGFLGGYLRRRPARCLRAWRLPRPLFIFLWRRDRGLLKQAFIQTFMRGDSRAEISVWAREFSARLLATGMRAAALRTLRERQQSGDYVVLLSASPDLYVPEIGRQLNIDRVICTGVAFRDERLEGTLITPNRRGKEKARVIALLREEFPTARIAAFGNAASDLAHLALVDEPWLVNAGPSARRQAAALHIAIADWR